MTSVCVIALLRMRLGLLSNRIQCWGTEPARLAHARVSQSTHLTHDRAHGTNLCCTRQGATRLGGRAYSRLAQLATMGRQPHIPNNRSHIGTVVFGNAPLAAMSVCTTIAVSL
jgi:hypothetical protein